MRTLASMDVPGVRRNDDSAANSSDETCDAFTQIES
jgi:hypothetical protein